MDSTSPKRKLNSIDFRKVAIGACVAVVGALLTYLTELVSGIDFGDFTAVVVSVWSIIANVVRKWLKDYTK